MADAIKVTGLREFVRTIKAVDRDLPKALRMSFNDAAKLVVEGAVPDIPVRRGRARRSVKARSTTRSARVSAGGNAVPYYAWLDFGGRVGRRNSVSRPFFKEGRYLYPTYNRLRDSGVFQDALADALARIARRAGLEMTGDGR